MRMKKNRKTLNTAVFLHNGKNTNFLLWEKDKE